MTITEFVTILTRRVPLVEQELWGSSYSIFNFICMFCRSLFILLRFTDSDYRFGFFKLALDQTDGTIKNGKSRDTEISNITNCSIILFYTNLYYLFTDSFAITCNVFGEVYHVHAKFETSIRKISYLKLKKKNNDIYKVLQ
jgi:hypothetical protein